MQEWLLLASATLAAGAVAGVLAGLFGIGGGIVIVPVLEAVLGFIGVDPAIRMHVAVATSLATIIPTSISSARAHHKRQSVDVEIVKRWALFVLIGALAGAWIASRVHSNVLAMVFATVATIVGLKMLFFPEVRNITESMPRNPFVMIIPVIIGCASTMMGIGGGVMSVTTLTLFGVPIHRAVGTAALFGLAISLPGTIGFVLAGLDDPRVPLGSVGYVNLVGFAIIAPTTYLLAPLGAKIAHSISAKRLTICFGAFLFLAALRMYYRALA